MSNTDVREKAQNWLKSNIDSNSKSRIAKLLADPDPTELFESFYKDLEFGTGGLRGIMGVGSNRMNKYTVGMATQGLSNYLRKAFPMEDIRVAIAHDSRNNSVYFTEIAASVFTANGITVYCFPELRPTPELSFAIRHFKCQSGVVITASHNPKEYNGYKAYWSDGAQVVAPHDSNIIEEVSRIQSLNDVKFENDPSKRKNLDTHIDDLYLSQVEKLSLNAEAIYNQSDLRIVFSPIHGSGITLIPKVLRRLGFSNVHVVEEQSEPNGDFPTVIYPNPEETEAMNLALKLGESLDADLIMATDPDADRVGIATKNLNNKFELLNGNQTASLLTYYLLDRWKEAGKLNGKQFTVSTIVTTELIDQIAKGYGVDSYKTLTGFKHIASVIRELEGKKEFIGGGEESYGFMVGDFVRDKDAVASCAVIAEMVAHAKNQDKSLFELMLEMYVEYGFYKERLVSMVKTGISGSNEIKQMMTYLRENPPIRINNSKLTKTIDYQLGVEKNLDTGVESEVALPKSNVLQFLTEDGTKISARPSGTEPKIKFYISVRKELGSKEGFSKLNRTLENQIDAIALDLGVL